MHRKKSKIQIQIEYFFFRMVVDLFRILPLKAAYFLADIISFLAFHLDFKHSRRAITHVLHSGIRTQRSEARKLARESFRHMIKLFVEIIKFDQIINENNYRDYVRIADDPESQRLLNSKTTHPCIFTTAHVGNWELAGSILTLFTGIPMTSIMRPLENEKIGNYIYSHRARFRHKTISKEKGLRPLLLAHKEGQNITIVADQHANHTEGVEVTFFGHPARAHATPALLHLKTGTPIAMPYMIRLDNSFHFEYHCDGEFTYTPTGDKHKDIQAIAQMYTDHIEQVVRRYPEQWLWAHRRWLDCNRSWEHPQSVHEPGKIQTSTENTASAQEIQK